jgi:hypothetical protein
MKSPMKRAAPRKASAKRKSPSKVAETASPVMHEDMKYRAQDALHTLKRAHEIQQDPQLMGHVKKHAANEREILKKIARKS